MTFKKVTIQFLLCLTLLTIVLGFAFGLALCAWMPENYPAFYPVIPLFFYVYGILYIIIYGQFPDKGILLYIGGKAVKLILSLLFLLLYAQLVKDHIKTFLIIFLFYYLVYLVFESAFFLKYEYDLKSKKVK